MLTMLVASPAACSPTGPVPSPSQPSVDQEQPPSEGLIKPLLRNRLAGVLAPVTPP